MRNSVWDSARGFAIISVVMIHACGILSQYNQGLYYSYVGLVLRQALNFAVPVFLFISGYFSYTTKKETNTIFILKRLERIIPPYLTISIVFIVVSSVVKGTFNFTSDIIFGIFFGNAITIGYFIIVLTQFVIITPLFKLIRTKRTHIYIMVAFSILGLLYAYITRIFFTDLKISTFPFSSILFFVWYPFYHLGFYISKYQPKITVSYSVIVCCLVLTLLESLFINKISTYAFATSQIKISSFLLSGSICLWIYNRSKTLSDGKKLAYLGQNSFGIYLIHIPFIKLGMSFVEITKINEKFPILSVVITTAFALLVSLAITMFIKFVLPKSKYKYIIG